MRALAGSLSLLLAAGLLAVARAAPQASNATVGLPLLLDASLEELRAGLDSGRFHSEDLVKAYLARIDELNSELRAVIEINPAAVVQARALDAEVAAGKAARGPLHGIPVLVKDVLATRDGMNTTAGPFAVESARPGAESTVVTKLRQAGAILLGKTNLSQWSNSRSLQGAPNGWSARGGLTKGAYFEAQDPSGSSSGSAVAASIGMAWAAIGTDTVGSLLQPAASANCVGLRPTVGRVSRHMMIPTSRRMNSIGPIARTVKDAAYLLAAIAGQDAHDNYTAATPDGQPDYVAACKLDGLKNKRIGVISNLIDAFMANDSLIPYDDMFQLSHAAMGRSLEVLSAAGAEIVEFEVPGLVDYARGGVIDHFDLFMSDMIHDFPEYYLKHLETNPYNLTSLQDVLDFTVRAKSLEEYPKIPVDMWSAAFNRSLISGTPEYWEVYDFTVSMLGDDGGVTAAFREHSLDAIVMPPSIAGGVASLFGIPAVTVPLAVSPSNTSLTSMLPTPSLFPPHFYSGPGLPLGLVFVGKAFDEEALLGMAYAFEQRTKVCQAVHPKKKPRTELADVVRQHLASHKLGRAGDGAAGLVDRAAEWEVKRG